MIGQILLWVFSIGSFCLGALILSVSANARHQIEGGICLIISSIFFVGALIVGELLRMQRILAPSATPRLRSVEEAAVSSTTTETRRRSSPQLYAGRQSGTTTSGPIPTLASVPSTNAIAEPSTAATRVQRRCAIAHGADGAACRTAALSQGGFPM